MDLNPFDELALIDQACRDQKHDECDCLETEDSIICCDPIGVDPLEEDR